MNQESLIIGPCVTEKGTAAGEKSNQVVFRVTREASKGAIREAVERLFKVTVVKVRTANFLGKKRVRGRQTGKRPDWKKAYVTLKAGERIEFFEGV
jgi:large subunit ribosomal protein L23